MSADMANTKARWNFRIGPLQITSPVGVISIAVIVLLIIICCCGSWVVGKTSDDVSPTPSAAPSRTTPTPAKTSTKPKSTTSKPSPKTDPRFKSCAAANAKGYGPYKDGEPEYDWYDDRDGDGIVCEPG